MDRAGEWSHDLMPQHLDGLSEQTFEALRTPFDFIVVGSGYAGSLVASRLASTGCYRVLLVEAGPAPDFESFIPFLQPMKNLSEKTWKYKTIEQRYAAQGLIDSEAKLKTGKALGGSSMVDSGVYLPENPDDFRRWHIQYSLPEWSDKAIEPYFFKVQQPDDDSGKAAEGANSTAESAENPDRLDNTTNPTQTRKHRRHDDLGRKSNPLSFLWVQAGMAMGYPVMSGVEPKIYDNGAFFIPNLMSRKGVRITPATQFLSHANHKLTVLTSVEATRVIFDQTLNAAVGVELYDPATNRTVSARSSREVVISAGGIGSPKLLIQSGVGPVDHLDELKIPTIQHLPVGTQLRDRVRADLFISIRSLFPESLRKKLSDMAEVMEYFQNGTGLLASSSMFGAAILKTDPKYSPDLLIEMKPIGIVGMNEMDHDLNYKPETKQAIDPFGELERDGGLQVTLTVLNPFSVGTMWLKRRVNSTEIDPIVNPSYLQDDRDLVTLVKGAQFVEAMMESDYMRLLNAKLLTPQFRGCPNWENSTSVSYWRCTLRNLATSGNHITSTNAMLQVTEPDLKVRGVNKLRVVDESVFPEPVTGGLPASIMAMANKGAQHIMEANNNQCFVAKKKLSKFQARFKKA